MLELLTQTQTVVLFLALEPTNQTSGDPLVGVSGVLDSLGGEVGNKASSILQLVADVVARRSLESRRRRVGAVLAPRSDYQGLVLAALVHSFTTNLRDPGREVFLAILIQSTRPNEGIVADLAMAPVPCVH